MTHHSFLRIPPDGYLVALILTQAAGYVEGKTELDFEFAHYTRNEST